MNAEIDMEVEYSRYPGDKMHPMHVSCNLDEFMKKVSDRNNWVKDSYTGDVLIYYCDIGMYDICIVRDLYKIVFNRKFDEWEIELI